jgi:hypothetical protein
MSVNAVAFGSVEVCSKLEMVCSSCARLMERVGPWEEEVAGPVEVDVVGAETNPLA